MIFGGAVIGARVVAGEDLGSCPAEKWARYIALAFSQASWLVDPNRIVIGGSVSALYPLVKARVLSQMQDLQSDPSAMPDISVETSGCYGSALGAACLMHERFMSLQNEDLIIQDSAKTEATK